MIIIIFFIIQNRGSSNVFELASKLFSKDGKRPEFLVYLMTVLLFRQ